MIEGDTKNVHLLSANGQTATIWQFCSEDRLKGIKCAEVLSSHTYVVLQFYNHVLDHVRAKGETVVNYVASLRAIAQYCN